MNDCIFCKIVSGEIPAHKLYEDEHVLAFLDISPIRMGHTLVIPKTHEPNVHHLDTETYQAVFAVAKQIAEKQEKEISPKRVGFMVMGWDVPHAHVHVVPMEETTDITSEALLTNTTLNPTQEELKEVAQKLSL